MSGSSPAAVSTETASGQVMTNLCAVICTRDRPLQLRRALHSLMAQERPASEILVVDNAPINDVTELMVRNEFSTVRYVRESSPGLDFARNRALAETSQDIVAFLDDDAVADPAWVAETAAVFHETESIAICTGKVEALSLETEGQRLFEANGGFARGNVRLRLPHDVNRILHSMPVPLIAWAISLGSGCSLAVRRERIIEIGGFDEALDMGPVLPGGGDLDIIWRTLNAGYEVIYEPRVHARHDHRRDVRAAINQILEHNRSLIVVLTKALGSARGSRRLEILVFLLWRLAKPAVRLARRAVGHDPLPASALLGLWRHCLRGLGTYPAMRRLAEQRRKEFGHSESQTKSQISKNFGPSF